MAKLRTLAPRVATLSTRLASLVPGSWRTTGMGSTARGYGYQWQQRRKRQLQEFPLCALCERAGRITSASIADHIEPHRGDPVKFEGPIQSLCKSCHDSIKRKEEATAHNV